MERSKITRRYNMSKSIYIEATKDIILKMLETNCFASKNQALRSGEQELLNAEICNTFSHL